MSDFERDLFAQQALEMAKVEYQNNQAMQQMITKLLGAKR